eukprot:m.310011 g.310011  ORF g.310011 m.310011 type:complete len:137 (+) comp49103_c0_seq1:76-486(+)
MAFSATFARRLAKTPSPLSFRTFHSSLARLFDVKSEEDFQTLVLESKKPVIVDFHADWCGPCRVLTPILEKCIEEKKGQVELAKVNVDDLQELAIEYTVSSIPRVIGFKNGNPVDDFVGVKDEKDVRQFLDSVMNS